MKYTMTDEYASAMVTVIPVIMVVATVEFQALLQRKVAEPPAEGATVSAHVRALAEFALLLFWFLLIISHTAVELRLIDWLATTQRKPDHQLAGDVRWVGGLGFLSVASLTALLLVRKQSRLLPAQMASLLRDLRRLRRGEKPTSTPSQRAQLPQQRLRPRPSYPAHRAVRRGRRPTT